MSARVGTPPPAPDPALAGYAYAHGDATAAHAYLLPTLLHLLEDTGSRHLFEIGCGNGWVANELTRRGFEVRGIDPSAEGIAFAQANFPQLDLAQASAYDDLAAHYGRFPVVYSLEVVEHLFDPRQFMRRARDLLAPGGRLILSTPFHGYWKNLALALSGRMDRHWDPLWDGGHIKFWSEASLGRLISEAGFEDIRFYRVGRVPVLAKSLFATARHRRGN